MRSSDGLGRELFVAFTRAGLVVGAVLVVLVVIGLAWLCLATNIVSDILYSPF